MKFISWLIMLAVGVVLVPMASIAQNGEDASPGVVPVAERDSTATPPSSPQIDEARGPRRVSPPGGMQVIRLPEHYLGPDVATLIADMQLRNLSRKGEFESTVEFRERRQRALVEPLADGLPPATERIFVVDPGNYRPLRYNADRQLASWKGSDPLLSFIPAGCMASTTAADRLDAGRDAWTRLCRTQVLEDEISEEEAQTRMGVRFRINAYRSRIVGVALCDQPISSNRGAGTCAPFAVNRSISLTPYRARVLLDRTEGRLRLAVVGTIAEPLFLSGQDFSNASLDNPTSMVRTWTLLRLIKTGLIFFDQESGEVLLRLPDPTTPAPTAARKVRRPVPADRLSRISEAWAAMRPQ